MRNKINAENLQRQEKDKIKVTPYEEKNVIQLERNLKIPNFKFQTPYIIDLREFDNLFWILFFLSHYKRISVIIFQRNSCTTHHTL
jgi:hypothetical protein